MRNQFKIKKKLTYFDLDIDYGFEKGVLIIEGESGAGKTTILNCISGLINPDFGEIKIQGRTVFQNDPKEKINVPTRKRGISHVFQNYALFPNMNVEENILYGIKNLPQYKNKEKKQALVDYAGELMKSFGIEHLRKKKPDNISGGEKQRVALLRGIVTKPKLLLMDEPFSALDKKTKEKVYEEFLIFKRTFEIPTVLITHDARESERLGDEVLVIEEGRIVNTGKK